MQVNEIVQCGKHTLVVPDAAARKYSEVSQWSLSSWTPLNKQPRKEKPL